MSGLEDAAAALARQKRQAAESAATRYAETQRAQQQNAAFLRERAREFFVFARDHGTPTFPLYLYGSMEHDGAYARMDETCVMASTWHLSYGWTGELGHRWAVTSGGGVYTYARIERRQRIRDARRYGIRDEVFVVVDMRSHDTIRRSLAYRRLSPHFVAAAAALLDPVRGSTSDPEKLTGIQSDGSIGYLL
ncbi:hypothetical protein [Peterkaempfera sp. SMS 1(5)a]|uniref:hypothetical protein n=1 Tax=Peterkaempfera podocarpi TaxID=3232308 RepID=UPI00366DE943